MKKLIFILISITYTSLFGQTIEVAGGLGKPVFYNFKQASGHFRSSYSSRTGYSARFAIDNIKASWLNLRLTLSVENYNGQIEVSDGGLGFNRTTTAQVDKSLISIGIFPINCIVRKKVNLNVGFNFSRLLNESFSGTTSGWTMDQIDKNYDLQEKYTSYSALNYFGLTARLAYDIHLTNNLIISPQYSFYSGLSKEFIQFPEMTKSLRNHFRVGIKKIIK